MSYFLDALAQCGTEKNPQKTTMHSGKGSDLSDNKVAKGRAGRNNSFQRMALARIQRALNQLMVEGIKYEQIKGGAYEMHLFENEEIETYLSNLFAIGKPEKTLYNYVQVDSSVESEYGLSCETDEKVKFYFKLAKAFKIQTPIGAYNPDWAVIFENDKKIYFVAETKSSIMAEDRRADANMKI